MNLTAIQGNIVSMRGNLLAMDARKPFIIEIDTTKGRWLVNDSICDCEHIWNIN